MCKVKLCPIDKSELEYQDSNYPDFTCKKCGLVIDAYDNFYEEAKKYIKFIVEERNKIKEEISSRLSSLENKIDLFKNSKFKGLIE